ncbi:extracellular solute-binding protein (plasmid) [Pseudohalocynthiibacter aestuariivivens]|nr:extracellular solute-binding protein [Pseudohalocynthiibacter aestuariivivens]QIE48031.1 extracellular solute-binding protein [Pseudohalocynthiibacter aestuariivivens]
MARQTSGAALLALGLALAPQQSTAQDNLPSYYPSSYSDLIEAAKQEDGKLVIYSSYDQPRWNPVFEAFMERYPFVSSVKNLDMEGEQVYEKLRAESSRGIAGGDIVEIQPSVGALLRDQQDLILAYDSVEASQYNENIIEPYENGYQYTITPVIIGYNKAILPEDINSLSDLAKQIAEDTSGDLMVGVRDIKSAYAFTGYYSLLDARPELWDAFEVILPKSRPEGSSGSMLTKLQTGEYAATVYISSATMISAADKSSGLLGYTAPQDGTSFQGGAVSIASSTKRPATAKLFIDFMLSQDGQQAILEGGRTAIRKGLEPASGMVSFEEISQDLSDDAVVTVPYETITEADKEAFAVRWNSLRDQ